MSRIVYFDCASGASGDMLLGAVVDLGLPIDQLREELTKLPLLGYRIEARKVNRSGLSATKVDVVAEGPSPAHRHLRHIVELLDSSALSVEVKERAGALFRRLAEAASSSTMCRRWRCAGEGPSATTSTLVAARPLRLTLRASIR